tara:strand:+ start:8184 stop:9338 length:1155 start_codon:yes stop_codon:yes gene_type:complete
MKIISYGKQSINNNDIDIVNKAIISNKITTGNFVKKFEKKLQNLTKAKYVISCSSGTAALHLAFSSINLKPGDVVIVPSINFISTCNILRLMGANIYLSDVDPVTGQMTTEQLIDCIRKNNLKKIKAIVTMYLGGHIFKNIDFFKLKKKYNFLIVEDACHALGSKYRYNKKKISIGSCKHADISTFSFHPIKSITTGEGGAMTTNRSLFAKNATLFRSHGIERNKKHWNYQISSPGLNYRLSDLNCALGVSQIKRIGLFMAKRESISKKYKKAFFELKKKKIINFVSPSKDTTSSNHLFILNIDFIKLKKTKDSFFNHMLKNNIICQYHYIPIYRFNSFKKLSGKLVNTEKYYKNAVSLPIHCELNNKQQNRVIKSIFKFINKK